MSGKAYTMKEMKAIVDYLTERRAYGEIRGRKMWMEFENSKFTDRTWQSLKETFLKRILPDIHNPYYQLSLTQISSFRAGYDVESKLGNKLEIRNVNEESNTKVDKPLNTETPSTSNKEENKKGEETINSKTVAHHRSSAETIVIDPCYETAEDIQRDLESPKQEKENEKEKDDKSPAKSLRDFITYSEPLTPMLQEVIEDFATDEEREGSDTETRMEIAEDVNTDKNPKNSNGHISDVRVEISSEADDMSTNEDMQNEPQEVDKKQPAKEVSNKNIKELEESVKISNSKTDISAQEVIEIEDTDNCEIQNNKNETTGKHVLDNKENKNSKEIVPNNNDPGNVANNTSEDNVERVIKNNEERAITSQMTCSQNDSSTTVDTLLPNNQEELNIESVATVSDSVKKTISKESQPKKLTLNKNSDKYPKKRANSQEPTVSKKKRQVINESSKKISVSDTDAAIKQNAKLKTDKAMLVASHKQKVNMLQRSSRENQKVYSLKEDVKDLQRVTEEKIDENCKEETNKSKDQEIHVDNSKTDVINSSVENPCLKSVSLYDEQFTSMKYSESSDAATTNKNIHQDSKGDNKNSSDDVIALKSNSETDNNEIRKKKKGTPVGHVVPKSEREKALANVFGFSSGAVASSRKRRFSYQNRSTRRQSHTKISSESSEWTSETDSEFISPPRGRRNRHTKKYLKPKSARILSLEEEGGLFVMYGKKIYPVVKDGKIVKNYVTYSPERDSEDEQESYWKLKYIEEKKRTSKLTKLLSHTTDDDPQSNEKGVTSDATKPSPPKKPKLITDESESKEKKSGQEVVLKEHSDIPHPASPIDKTLKIKIVRQNEEVQLEGHWSQIHPVLDHVVQIFHKEVESRTSVRSTPQPEQRKSVSSGISTPLIAVPIDPEVHEKVNKLETEIFQEIEARDKQEKQSEELPKPVQESKVTKRRGRPRKSISQSRAQSPEKKPNVPMPSPKLQIEENAEKLPPAKIENETGASLTRRTRTPKKVLHESTERNDNNVINTRNKKTKEVSVVEAVEDETDVRYKFPSPPPSEKKTYRKSGANKTPKQQKSINS
ncbi:unnamed protein product [Parnassius mnemosyne]